MAGRFAMQHFLAGSRVVQLACVVHNNNSGIALNIAINSRKLTARTTGRGNLIYFSFLIENPARTITYFPASALSLPGADIETAGYPIAIGQ